MTTGGTTNEPTPEQQIEILKQQLAQAQRLTALGELVSTTTHEFNNVLMTILNYAKHGLRHRDDKTRQKAFEKIFGAATRAAKITNGVLGIARNRATGQEPTDLIKLIEDTLVLLERELSKYRIALDKHLHPVPEAVVNGNQIQQVILNLLINARQAMSGGGRLVLKLWHDAEADTVNLMIRDNGCGIPPDKLPHIFDSFFTTKSGPDASGKGGTGLGLSMCRDIIEAHHGRIRVESTVGRGTAFTLILPAVKKAASKRPAIFPAISTPPGISNPPGVGSL